MPVVTSIPALSSPPTNVFGLAQYVAGRVPGYDFSEYLRELNSAYIHVWEEVSKLKNNYFTNIVTVTVAQPNQRNFDLLYNADGNLSAAVSPRLYQITRVRVQPPFGNMFQNSVLMPFNDQEFMSVEALSTSQSTQTGPYYFALYGHGRLRIAIPVAVGTTFEITYTYWPLALSYMSSSNPPSSVSSAGTTVSGTSTTFTQIVPPDFQSANPVAATVDEEFIQAELVCNGQVAAGGQAYRVAAIASDTSLITMNAISPALTPGSAYVLAAVPEIPREHIRVIASVAMPKVYGWIGDDQRIQEATAIATANIQMMKDSLIERQSNNPPRKQRFAYGVSRRNRAFLR